MILANALSLVGLAVEVTEAVKKGKDFGVAAAAEG
jgi:hypothetical protein